MSKERRTGQCLCGKIRFQVDRRLKEVGACHCTMCLRWSSGPYLELDCGDSVVFEGEEHIVRYKSSDWAERGFCGSCGSNLLYYLLPTGEYMMSAGAFDDQSGLKFTHQVFIDEKPDWYAFENRTKTMTGAEIFAMYAQNDDY